jgi:hypothetical protein
MSNRFFWECSPIYRCRTSDSGPSMILSNKIKSKKMRHLRLSKSNQMLLTKTISIPRLLGKQLQISYWVCPWLDDLVSADKHSQNPDHMPLTLMMIKNICGGSIMLGPWLYAIHAWSLVLCPGGRGCVHEECIGVAILRYYRFSPKIF